MRRCSGAPCAHPFCTACLHFPERDTRSHAQNPSRGHRRRHAVSRTRRLGLRGRFEQRGGSNDSPKELTYWASNQGASIEVDKKVLQPELDKFEK
ncbi:hypothetical protein SALBM217S_10433 [Streptomyces griseoloalbus]